MHFLYFFLFAGYTLFASENVSTANIDLALNLKICKAQLNVMMLEEEIAYERLEYDILTLESTLYRELPDAVNPKLPDVYNAQE